MEVKGEGVWVDKSHLGAPFGPGSAPRRGTPTSGLHASEKVTLVNLALNLKRTPEQNRTRPYRVVASTYRGGRHILKSGSDQPLPTLNMGPALGRDMSVVNQCPT